MQTVQITALGGYGQLKLVASPDLQPGPRQVRLAVHAVGVNYADCGARMRPYASASTQCGSSSGQPRLGWMLSR